VLTTDVSKFLGHRNFSTTTRYLNTTSRPLRMALLRVEQARAESLANSCKNQPESSPKTDDAEASSSPSKSLGFLRLKVWCGRGDSNPYDLAIASPSSWCVCQFRHFREGG
jgi:hypothetical protein